MSDHVIVIDESYDAILLRDLLEKAAKDHYVRAAKAVHPTIRTRHQHKADVFAKYAERCEQIRLDEVEHISGLLGLAKEPT